MKAAFLAVTCIALASCADHSTPETTDPLPPADVTATSNKPKKNELEIREQTRTEKLKAEQAADKYFAALWKSIGSIDDGVSSPDLVAKAAIAENHSLLRAKFAAQCSHIRDSSWLGEKMFNERMAALPTPYDVHFATNIVLRYRGTKRSNPTKEETESTSAARYQAYLKRLRSPDPAPNGP